MNPSAEASPLKLFLLVFLLGCLLFLPTLQPGIGWYNSPELAFASMTLDVPHQPGYPLFTRLANLFQALPWNVEPARKVNLLSAILGAMAGGLGAIWLYGRTRSWLFSVLMPVWMFSFVTFWEQATSAEVYTLEILLLATSLNIIWMIRDGMTDSKGGVALGLVLFLGIGHRPTFMLYMIAGAVVLKESLLRFRDRTAFMKGFVLGSLIGLIPTIDLYLRLQNPVGYLTDPRMGEGFWGFWRIFTAADFRKGLGGFTPVELVRRLFAMLRFFAWEGRSVLLLIPLLAGIRVMVRRSGSGGARETHEAAGFCLWIMAVNSGFVLNYDAFEAQTMLLPTVFAACLLSGLFLGGLKGSRNLVGPALAIFTACSLLISATRIEPRNREAETWAARSVALVPEHSILIVSNDVEYRPYLYLQFIKRFRWPMGFTLVDSIEERDLARLEQLIATGKTFGSLIFPENLASTLRTRYHIVPHGYLQRILPGGNLGFFAPPPETLFRPGVPTGACGACEFTQGCRLIPLEGRGGVERPGMATQPAPIQTGPIPAHPGDVLIYGYRLSPPFSGLPRVVIKTLLLGPDSRPLESHGLITGHDIHFPASMTSESSRAGDHAFPLFFPRTLVIPPDTPGGTYRLVASVDLWAEEDVSKNTAGQLEGVSPFNAGGFLEVFRLKNGLGNRMVLSRKSFEASEREKAATCKSPEQIELGRIQIP